jgi:DNA-binding transcriptional LysR family regulator
MVYSSVNCVPTASQTRGNFCSGDMNTVQLRNFDLNLLVVFDVIMKERSIAGASERLRLSQSAVSHALSRLRKLVGDELFIRESDGMRPTVRAIELGVPVQCALSELEIALTAQDFVPERTVRTFHVAASDYSCTLFIPRLVERLAAAPKIDIYVVPANRLDVIQQLDDGRIDVAIAWFAVVPERFGRAKLLSETNVFVVRAGHPLASGKVTAARALSYPHVIVDYVGNAENLIDGFLPERGALRRVRMERAVINAPPGPWRQGRVALKVPNYCNVPAIVARTEMVASVPRRIAAELLSKHDLVVLESPFDTEPVAVEAIWHRRTEADPGITWLRRQVELAAADLN